MNSNLKNGHWVVASYPEGDLSVENFELRYDDVPEPEEGEFLIKTTALVMSPPLRMAVGTGGITGNVIPIGKLMRGSGQGI
ncbi:MAG: NADP-dependent oxidoreductase, partial [Proteobacteria bacterium]|nr:NADP-dependent oxidoreductase [Pseudomonadota bacterium]